MTFVRTVLGDVPPGALGPCYAHEHLVIDGAFVAERFPELRLASVERATEELRAVVRAGGRAAVDCMPWDAGRDVEKLAAIARGAGVHVIATTGLHLPKYYPADHPRHRLGAGALAEVFVREIESGMDGTAHRAGAVKAAAGGRDLDAHEHVVFEAVARAHLRTGAPILTHTEAGAGLEQIAFLRSRGVDPRRVILSHTDRVPELALHRALLATGARLAYDRAFRGPLDPTNPTLRLLVDLLPRYPDQLLLGTDAAKPTYWSAHGGTPGLPFLLTTFVPWLRAAVGPELVERLLVANPAAAFSFGT